MSYSSLSPNAIAELVTSIESALLNQIHPDEFNDAAWAKSEKESKSPNLIKFIIFSNKFTYWIISEILRTGEVSQRANVLTYFLGVGDQLLRLRNFNGASLVSLAVRHPAVLRLKKTWKLIDAKTQGMSEKLYDMFLLGLDTPVNNYESYRRAIQTVKPPFIPYMRLLLEEIADASTDPQDTTISTRHFKVTVQNRRMYGLNNESSNLHSDMGVISENKHIVQHAQSETYTLNVRNSSEFENYILYYQALDNEETYKESLTIEPRQSKQSNSSTTLLWVGGALVVAAVSVGLGYYFVTKKNK